MLIHYACANLARLLAVNVEGESWSWLDVNVLENVTIEAVDLTCLVAADGVAGANANVDVLECDHFAVK